jgi:hypothetical protein|tara:strand:+ start:830 stop:1012 length:183 start_codon:yes stop_codon:yes gene_type:complete
MKNADTVNVRYINFTMEEIYNLVSDIYEGLMDEEWDDTLNSIREIKLILSQLEGFVKEDS